MNFKKVTALLLSSTLVLGLAGCGKTAEPAKTAQPKKTVEITFWHAMGGVNGKAIDTLVENFNKTHKDVHVTAQFQGTYDDELTKLKTAMQGKSGPDICQVYDIGSRYMIDSGYVVPMQNFIDKDKYDKSQLEPNLLGYYTIDNKLWSMPFNSSTPILYYNKNAFKEAGLDPNTAPKTFAEIEDYAKKLTKKSGDKVSQYGFSMAIYGWFFEQLLAKQGAMYADNDNGRTARATAVAFDKGDAGLNILNEWKKLVDSGYVGNFGRKTDDTKNAFTAGRTAMILESTAALGGLVKGAGTRFEIGTAFLPSIGTSSNDGGVIIGGGSLWAIDNKDTDKQNAAWEFIKYVTAPEQQMFWSQQSGYFAVTKKAYEIPEMKDYLDKHPQFKTAIEQLHQTPVNKATVGGLVGVFAEARATMETNIENMLQKKQSPQDAINNAAKSINSAIEKYNSTVKK